MMRLSGWMVFLLLGLCLVPSGGESAMPRESARVLDLQSGSMGCKVKLIPETVAPGSLVEAKLEVFEVPAIPDPVYGDRVPAKKAILTAEILEADGASGSAGSVIYHVHPMQDAGTYGFHFTLDKKDTYRVVLRGQVQDAPFSAAFRVMAGGTLPDQGQAPVPQASSGRAPETRIGDLKNGERLYQKHCASCHGSDGSGNGPNANTLGKVRPGNLRDGSIMNTFDDEMLSRVIQLGQASSLVPAMPGFAQDLDSLSTWDVAGHLRQMHLPLRLFFPQADQYLAKFYVIGKEGTQEFRDGQLERLRKELTSIDDLELKHRVFTIFKDATPHQRPELIPQEPRRLAELRKENKLGYVFFMPLSEQKGKTQPVGLALDPDFAITKLVAASMDASLVSEYNGRLAKYVGLGKRGETFVVTQSKEPAGKALDAAVRRIYLLAVEAANDYELEEKERSWADGTF